MKELLEKLFEPGKRYTGGKIVFIKEQGVRESAQIIQDEIAVQLLVVAKNFTKPKRPNLQVVKEKGISLSFTVEIETNNEGLVAKDVQFEL